MRWTTRKRQLHIWTRWWAWRPVLVNREWVWLEYVERALTDRDPNLWVYRNEKMVRTPIIGHTIKYRGDATTEQVRWGSCADPRGLLIPGDLYIIAKVDIHSQHTIAQRRTIQTLKIYLAEFPGLGFNSVHFDEAPQ